VGVLDELTDFRQLVREWYEREWRTHDLEISFKRHHDRFFSWAYEDHPVFTVTARDQNSGIESRAILKMYGTQELALEERKTLSRLSSGFGDPSGFGAPLPLAMFLDSPALLMTKVSGKRLSHLIWPTIFSSRPVQPSVVLAGIRSAGAWLAEYQNMAPDPERHELDGSEAYAGVSTLLEGHLKSSRQYCLSEHVTTAIKSWFSSIEDSVSKLTCMSVPTCDFQPTHIFVSDTKTSVIDFEWEGCGWPGENLASFLVYCEVYRSALSIPAISIEEVREVFLESYSASAHFGPAHRISLEVAYLVELLDTLLRPWLDHGQRSTKKASSLWRSWLARREIVRRTQTGSWRTLLE
jgi:hypothetical protein